MNVFEAVKQTVTTRQAAEMYGIRVSRNGMAVCPFHNDRNPSMKVDKRFHCFACQADGDAVDFVSRLFGLPSREAAIKLADDFGIPYDSRQKPSVRPHIREPTGLFAIVIHPVTFYCSPFFLDMSTQFNQLAKIIHMYMLTISRFFCIVLLKGGNVYVT